VTPCNPVYGYQYSFYPEYEPDTFFRNVDIHLHDHTASLPRRPSSALSLPSQPQIFGWCSRLVRETKFQTHKLILKLFVYRCYTAWKNKIWSGQKLST
jgi:hypothetical protein